MVLFLFVTWEQRKLGEVGKAQSGVGFPDREQGGKTGVPFYKVSDMNNAGNEHEMCTANNYVSEAQCKKNGWTPITEISVVFAKVGAAIMLNRKRLVRISFLLDNNTMAYKFGTEWNIDFGKTLFERIDLTDLVQIGALPSYNATDVECVEISMPDKPEQHRIGVFFKQLDNLITLHQRKQNDKFSLFKPKNYANFLANSWEQREFNSIAKRITEMTDTEDLPRVEYEDIVSGQGTLNKDINKKKSCKTGILFDNGDVLFGKLRPYLKNWLFATFMGIAVGDFWVLRANNADGLYIYTLLQIDAFQDIANQSTGTKMPRADWSLVSKQRFLTPTVVPEQRKIGEFFKQLDNLITLHQREHRQKKNPFLNENRSPFREVIANAWEQRKLGEVANIQKGQQLGKAEMSNNGAFYVLNGGMEPSGYTNQYNTFANTISISEGGNSCGYVSLNLEQFWSGGHNYTLQNPRIDTFFLYQWLKRHEKGIMALRVGSGLPNIQKSALQDVIVAYPKKSEQRAIAEILNKIDNLITLHQRGLIKIQGDKNGKKRSFGRIIQRLF